MIPAKYQYIAGGVLIIVAFAVGRHSVQSPKISVVSNTDTKTNIDKDKKSNTETIITTTKKPDGTVIIVKDIKSVTDTTTSTAIDSKTHTDTIITPPKVGTLNISGLVANDFSKGILQPTYGVSVTKEVLGPLTVGGFGLTNGVIGVSIGISF